MDALQNKQPILLVEANPFDMELTLRTLHENAIANEVIVTRDGQSALDYLFRRGEYRLRAHPQPCVILLNLRLPKVDGVEVLTQIRKEPSLSNIPVCIITASQEDKEFLLARRWEHEISIVKPFSFDLLREAMKKLHVEWVLVPATFTQSAHGRFGTL